MVLTKRRTSPVKQRAWEETMKKQRASIRWQFRKWLIVGAMSCLFAVGIAWSNPMMIWRSIARETLAIGPCLVDPTLQPMNCADAPWLFWFPIDGHVFAIPDLLLEQYYPCLRTPPDAGRCEVPSCQCFPSSED
jgi:hypothetical protein